MDKMQIEMIAGLRIPTRTQLEAHVNGHFMKVDGEGFLASRLRFYREVHARVKYDGDILLHALGMSPQEMREYASRGLELRYMEVWPDEPGHRSLVVDQISQLAALTRLIPLAHLESVKVVTAAKSDRPIGLSWSEEACDLTYAARVQAAVIKRHGITEVAVPKWPHEELPGATK